MHDLDRGVREFESEANAFASEPTAIQSAILRGERDENRLTNQVFFSRHPERQGKRIGRTEPGLASEWNQIRDRLVRPALAVTARSAPGVSTGDAAAASRVPIFFGLDAASVDGNRNADWARARNEGSITFAIIRANWGVAQDPAFKRDWQNIKNAGLIRGAYLFLRFPYATHSDPLTQAKAFTGTVGRLAEGDLPPSLDVEFPGGRAATGMTATQCLAGVRAAWKVLKDFYGVAPIIYTSARVWHEDLNDLPAPDLVESPLWLARYPFKKGPAIRNPKVFAKGRLDPKAPPAWGDATNWWIHQYQGDASQVPGLRQVDMNRFNTMTSGATGDRVTWVQRRLGIARTGAFDTTTAAAVRVFKQRKGFAATDLIDPRTFAFLCWSNPARRDTEGEVGDAPPASR
jgi:GH25 family lysozyme M1 (1,4-beta-N-acetylmuramidase)